MKFRSVRHNLIAIPLLLIAEALVNSAFAEELPAISQVVQQAFRETHDGWSSDEVLLQDELNSKFIAACLAARPNSSTTELNWKLLNIRKAGKLSVKVTHRRRDDHTEYLQLAEIVARNTQDKFKVSTDHIMCDPKQRAAFDREAHLVAPKVNPYLMRKAAFGLRKARKLRPELVLRIADWDRTITTHRASELVRNSKQISNTPGIYIFRDKTGYLYVGESLNLRSRLEQHLDDSDRQSLANYMRANGVRDITIEIHAFPKDSRGRKVAIRRAYESELIASRKPRFNVRP